MNYEQATEIREYLVANGIYATREETVQRIPGVAMRYRVHVNGVTIMDMHEARACVANPTGWGLQPHTYSLRGRS